MKPVPLRLRESIDSLPLQTGVPGLGRDGVVALAQAGLLRGRELQEVCSMPVGPAGAAARQASDAAAVDCRVDLGDLRQAPSPGEGSAWRDAEAEHQGSKGRLLALARTLEGDIIPRLVAAHAPAAPPGVGIDAAQVSRFSSLLIDADDVAIERAIDALRARGVEVAQLYLELFAPAARHLGELWEQDLCDFASVTIALGRLQRLLRHWTQAFGSEVRHPPNGRRVLLAQHAQEQHSFGLSMVAEFFRREGWEVLGGVGGAVADPTAQVARDWFDVVGIAIGSEVHVAWAAERIADIRATSRNREVVVLVGGPLLSLHPEWSARLGADASAHEGGAAPALAERLVAERSGAR
jgi:MerR family transcriptional regulator, light-induced transcriptional regulator